MILRYVDVITGACIVVTAGWTRRHQQRPVYTGLYSLPPYSV